MQDAIVIGAQFDTDIATAGCRLAFHGRLSALLDPGDKPALARLRIVKLKAKHGVIERLAADGCTAICRGMFKKETDMSLFVGMKVRNLGLVSLRRRESKLKGTLMCRCPLEQGSLILSK